MSTKGENQPRAGVPTSAVAEIEPSRRLFRRLLAANPNYFGSFPDLDLTAPEPKDGDTSYEELECVSYSPQRDRLEATVHIKRSFGYSGGPCTPGSFEHIRFYVNYGSGWDDAGAAAINVHDLPADRDCTGAASHPISYVAGVDHTPKRDWCGRPVLPRVRAILSWELAPPANDPGWRPPWGNVHDCRIQIRPRRFILPDLRLELADDLLAKLPPQILQEPPHPGPDPGPFEAMPLSTLAAHYEKADVPAHRFALDALVGTANNPFAGGPQLIANAEIAKAAGIDLASVLAALDKTAGDTTYEELECLGLDDGAESLVATFKVKKTSGYSGPPCAAGSKEYVAFWADWDDGECELEYLGTVVTTVHDYEKVGDGLCYAAVLPVDLGAHRLPCKTPALRRVRAVLSWNTPPSTTDPDDVPHWGNRLDRHVEIRPGDHYDGTARFTIVGGVAAQMVDLATGLTLPGATLGTSVNPLPNDCPFAGTVVLHGPLDPALVGHQYRIRAVNVDNGGTMLLTTPFSVVTSGGTPLVVTPNPLTGWVNWPSWTNNTTGVLGVAAPGGEDRWDFELELDNPGAVVAVARTQLDNTVRNTALLSDTVNAGDLDLITGGACKVPHGFLHGTFVARDRHFLGWSIVVAGGPGPNNPVIPVAAGNPLGSLGTGDQTPFAGSPFTLDFSDPVIPPCGYVVRLTITDRAIVNSVVLGNHTIIERGICLE